MYLPDFLSLDVPIPAPGPDKGPVCFTYDAKWTPYIISVVRFLTMDGVYESDQTNAKGEAELLLDALMGLGTCAIPSLQHGTEIEETMPLRIDCDCNVFVTCCDGTEKQILTSGQVNALIDGSATDHAPQPKQGGCVTYRINLLANMSSLLPTIVNAGDVLTFSNPKGTATDGSGSGIWYCPAGDIFFAGLCTGVFGTNGGDPRPASAHMGVIAHINGVWYDTQNPITVPGGVANAPVEFQVNDAAIADNSGGYSFDVQVCNNSSATWTKTLDFQLNPCGAIFPIPGRPTEGVWTPASGYMPSDLTASGCNQRRVEFQLDAVIAQLTSIELVYDLTHGNIACGSSPDLAITLNNDAIVPYNQPVNVAPNGSHQNVTVSGSWASVTNLRLYFCVCQSSAAQDGSGAVRQLILSGTGVEPTWPC